MTINIAGTNDAPTASNTTGSTNEDTTILNAPLPTAADVDAGDVVTYGLAQSAQHGSVVVNSDGSYSYTPAANFNGPDFFKYSVTDTSGAFNTYTVTITVNPVNDAPTASNVSVTVSEDHSINSTLPSYSDVESDAVTYSLGSGAAHGSAVVNGDGTYSYTPAANFNGSDSFTYTVSDGHGGSNTYTVSVTVTAVNDAPTASDTSITTNEDTAYSGNLPGASDVDGDTVTYSLGAPANFGTVVINANGSYTYTPEANFNGSDAFTYTVSDGHGGSNTYEVTVAVTAVNDAPMAGNAAVSTPQGQAYWDTLPGYSDIDGDVVTYSLVGATGSGTDGIHFTSGSTSNGATVIVHDDGTYLYTPNPAFYGSDSFSFLVDDGHGGTNTYTVTVSVIAPTNNAPTAANTSISTIEDTTATGTLTTGADVDGNTITYALVGSGSVSHTVAGETTNSTFVLNPNGSYTYTPAHNYNGSDTFTYKVNDGALDSATYTITVNVAAVNDAPTASNASITTDEDTAYSGSLPGYTDVDGDAVTYSLGSAASHGTAVVNANGTYTYTPALNFNGGDSFGYTINDSHGGSHSYTVSVTVTAVNDAPTASTASITTDEDTAYSGSLPGYTDVDGDAVTYSLGSAASHGTAVVSSDGHYTYTPAANFNGSDSFTYTVSDGVLSNTYTVSVTVTAVNDAPTAANATLSTNEDTVLTGTLVTGADVDGDAVTYVLVSSGSVSHTVAGETSSSTFVLNADGSYTYTPAHNYNGSDSFTYKVNDGSLDSATYTITVNVAAVNDAPTAANINLTIAEDTVASGNLPAASDVEGDSVTYSLGRQAGHGVAVVNNDGTYSYTPDANYNNTSTTRDNFTYTVSDGNGGSSTYTVNVRVTAVNDAPVLTAGGSTTAEDTAISNGALPAATDVDGDTVTYALATGVSHGSVTVNSNGTFSYTPAANYNGSDSFTYTINDGNGGSNTYTHSLTITPVNDAPTASNTSATTDEDTAISNGSLPAYTDVDGDTVTYSLSAQAAHGTAVVNANGTYTYTPAANYNGTDSFTYKVTDPSGAFNTYSVSLTIAAVNDAPTASNTSATTNEDIAITNGSLPAYTDIDGDTVTYSLGTQAAHGTAVVNTNGTYTYTPAANYNGTDSFTYKVTDPSGAFNTYSVSLTMVAVNDAPTASNTSISLNEDSTGFNGTLPAATDVEGDTVTYSLGTPSHGAVVFRTVASVPGTSTGNYKYTPVANYNGSDSFTYTINDGHGGTNTYTVSVTVVSVNDAPTASNTSATTNEDIAISNGSLPAYTDVDGDTVTYSLGTQAAHGTAVVNANGTYTYTPAANYNGTDSFTYIINDGNGGTNTYTVSLVITSVNDAPVLTAGGSTTAEDTAISNGALPAATDVDGDTVTYALATGVSHGSVTVNSNGTFSYTPAANYNGSDSFTYTINDGHGGSNTYTHSLTITPVNDAPVASSTSVTTTQDTAITNGTLPAYSDVDGDSVTYSLGTDATHGAAVVSSDGTYTYTPNSGYFGSDSFTYIISDGNGGTNTYTVTVAVAAASNTPPTAADTTVTTAEDTAITNGTLPAYYDADGDTATYSLGTQAAHGTAVVNANGTYTYTPAANFNGTDSFTYLLTDSRGGISGNYTVSVTVTAVNDAPTAANATLSTNEDTVLNGTLATGADVDGNAVTYALVSSGSVSHTVAGETTSSTFVLNSDGSYAYTPAHNYNGNDSFTYKVNDGLLDSATYTISVNVAAVNDAPVLTAGGSTTAEDTAISNGALPAATDVDGDTVTYALATGVSHGSVTVNSNGTFSYTPAANYNGSDSFTYTINDGHGGSNTYTHSLTITPVNDAPVAANPSVSTNEDTPLTITAATLPLGTDVDLDTLAYALKGSNGGALNGTVVFSGGVFTYTPTADFNGSDSFKYTVSDGIATAVTGTVTITVNPVNDAPRNLQWTADYTTAQGTATTIANGTHLANLSATDIEGNAITYSVSGNATISGNSISANNLVVGDNLIVVTATDSLGAATPMNVHVYVGASTADTLSATTNDMNVLYGLAGNDTITGGTANDVLVGAAGKDTLSGGDGSDIYVFGLTDSTTTNADTINDAAGTASLSTADQIVINSSGASWNGGLNFAQNSTTPAQMNITINSGTASQINITNQFATNAKGAIELLTFNGGGSYNGYSLGTSTWNLMNTTAPTSAGTSNGTAGNDILVANVGGTTLTGGLSTSLTTGTGNDMLFGGAGADTLNGGDGNDLLVGGGGTDTFIFAAGSGNDVITDINLGTNASHDDIIDLSAAGTGWTSAADVIAHTALVNGAEVITLSSGNTITLIGVGVTTNFDNGDFKFV